MKQIRRIEKVKSLRYNNIDKRFVAVLLVFLGVVALAGLSLTDNNQVDRAADNKTDKQDTFNLSELREKCELANGTIEVKVEDNVTDYFCSIT